MAPRNSHHLITGLAHGHISPTFMAGWATGRQYIFAFAPFLCLFVQFHSERKCSRGVPYVMKGVSREGGGAVSNINTIETDQHARRADPMSLDAVKGDTRNEWNPTAASTLQRSQAVRGTRTSMGKQPATSSDLPSTCSGHAIGSMQ